MPTAPESVEATQPTAAERPFLLPFLGLTCGVGVASIYYNQPLLLLMGRSTGAGAQSMGLIAAATQLGYAAGMVTFVPMGDVAERRGLIMKLFTAVSVALALLACAQNFPWMLGASVLVGMLAAVTHIVLPLAPDLAPRHRRGSAIGTVMTGLLLGVLLARSFAGWLSRLGGWRTVFAVAAVLNLVFVPVLGRFLPRLPPRGNLGYPQALRSLWTLIRTDPLLRESTVMGMLSFAAFSCFWTVLALLLHTHYGLGPGVAGSFGLVGAAGAAIAPFAGKLADRRGTRFGITVAGAILTGSFVILGAEEAISMPFWAHMAAMVFGVITLDVGQQMTQVSNQVRIFGLQPEARSRLNTVYMTLYFLGGAAGSALATFAWDHHGWTGVCATAIGLMALAALRHATGPSRHMAPVSRPDFDPAELG